MAFGYGGVILISGWSSLYSRFIVSLTFDVILSCHYIHDLSFHSLLMLYCRGVLCLMVGDENAVVWCRAGCPSLALKKCYCWTQEPLGLSSSCCG